MPGEHEEIKKLLEENLRVVKESHALLERMHRMDVYTFWMKALWFASIVGLPIIVYYLFLEPYFKALGVNSEDFSLMLKNIPHLINSPFGKILQ